MDHRGVCVLAVSGSRSTLRHLSRILSTLGYELHQAADSDQALTALDAVAPQLLIVDADLAPLSGVELCRAAAERPNTPFAYKLLLTEESPPEDLQHALASGVDDFLAKPLVHGELLTRIRTGVRIAEYERRALHQGRIDSLTGVLSRVALYDRLRQLIGSGFSGSILGCAVFDLDYFRRISDLHGRVCGDRVLQQVADTLRDRCLEGALVSHFEKDRFCVVLPDTSHHKAMEWCEQARHAIAALEIELEGQVSRLTASVGLCAGKPSGHTADEIVENALAALELAKRSGRDCLVEFGQFDEEEDQWRKLAAPGKLFENTTARDVMKPVSLALRLDEPATQAEALFAQTHLGAIPVVDEQGKLAGLVWEGGAVNDESADQAAATIKDLVTTDVHQVDENASFASLMDFFARDSRSLIVVVDSERPTGVIMRDSLVGLVQPPSTISLQPLGACSGGSDYLFVPEPRPVE